MYHLHYKGANIWLLYHSLTYILSSYIILIYTIPKEEIQMSFQYTVLQAALILTITIPLFVSPPDMSTDSNQRAFSFFVGLSATFHLYTLIGITILSGLFNRPYTEADTLIVRIENNPSFVAITACNYVSNVFCVIAVLIAGFDRSYFDGGMQSPIVVMVITLFYTFIKAYQQGNRCQDLRVYSFYKKYCMSDGRLKSEYMSIVKQ